MKLKIVIKAQMTSEKCRAKAMKLVASAGVESVAVEGGDRDQIVVVGDGVDPVCLTRILRKKIGHAYIIKVVEVKKEEDSKPEEEAKVETVSQCYSNCPPCPQVVYYQYPSSTYNADTCSIL